MFMLRPSDFPSKNVSYRLSCEKKRQTANKEMHLFVVLEWQSRSTDSGSNQNNVLSGEQKVSGFFFNLFILIGG